MCNKIELLYSKTVNTEPGPTYSKLFVSSRNFQHHIPSNTNVTKMCPKFFVESGSLEKSFFFLCPHDCAILKFLIRLRMQNL